MKKNIFLLWLQGWENAPWLQKKVLESWQINNPNWNIELIDQNNINNYVSDIDYIYDFSKKITPQAKSDIIRLSLLKNYGGIWADSTLLCMQPLDHWVFEAVENSGIWMYHGHGAYLTSDIGPASWFIISEKEGDLITKWKKKCDSFWSVNSLTNDYFWMDGLFKELITTDMNFKSQWLKTPYLYCEDKGSAHTLADYNYSMYRDSKEIKELLKNKPPYVIKLSSNWNKIFPDKKKDIFQESNANFAICLSKRRFTYKHIFQSPKSIPSPLKQKTFLLRLFISITKKFKENFFSEIDK